MALDAQVFDRAAALTSLAGGWDALAGARGLQSDLYDTHAWYSAWVAAAGAEAGDTLRVLAVRDGEHVRALLPLVARRGTWEVAGLGFRPRYRPILDTAEPDRGVLATLAEALAQQGMRRLSLATLPSRDPATGALIEALGAAGYTCTTRETTSDCLAPVSGNWDDHRRQFKKYDRTVKNFANKAGRLGDVRLLSFEPGDAPRAGTLEEGFASYTALHARGWKGPLREPMLTHRRELLQRAGAKGWAHIYRLDVAERPCAAILWFRIGDVAIAYSTVYDQQLAALSGGTIVMWWAHERLCRLDTPRLFDYLPGHGSQKDQLATERPPLLTLTAARRSLFGGWSAPLEDAARRAVRLMVGRSRKPRERTRRAGSERVRVRERRYAPIGAATLTCTPLDLNPALELFLTLAGGHASPQKMAGTWLDGDAWWQIGSEPAACARIGVADGTGARPVRELVLTGQPTLAREALLSALASAIAAPLVTLEADPAGSDTGLALVEAAAPLPWPPAAPADSRPPTTA